jgi:hypothetical protein
VADVHGARQLTVAATVPTAPGARNPVVTSRGVVYLAHGGGTASNELVVVMPSPK